MKKIFISFSFLMMAILPVFAQNNHWEYWDNVNPINPTSAVTVVHSNGSAYLFQSNGNDVYVSELDPITMQVVPNTSYYISVPANYYPLVLRGAYEDFSGDIVLYGSCGFGPLAALYDAVNHQIIQIMLDSNHIGDYFINGCCGYDNNGGMVNMLVLNQAGIIIPVDWVNSNVHYLGIPIGSVSDVVWDPHNSCFAAAGHQYSGVCPELFLLGFEYNSLTTLFIVNTHFAWNLPSYLYAEYQTNLDVLDDSNIVVGHNVRDVKGDDFIWLSRIYNYVNLSNYRLFRFPAPKLFLSDMKYDDSKNRLTILGEMNYCNSTYIAQTDPFTLASMQAAQITGSMPYYTCQINQNTLYGNDITLQKLEINPYKCNHILATGTYYDNVQGNKAYITETYDIFKSICDIPFNPNTHNVTCKTGAVIDTQPVFNIQILGYSVYLLQTIDLQTIRSCSDNRPCGAKDMDSTKRMSVERTASITIMGNGTLYFQGFENGADYEIYDVTGRIVATGRTGNGQLKTKICCTGLYIISAKDQFGNAVTKKFVYTHE